MQECITPDEETQESIMTKLVTGETEEGIESIYNEQPQEEEEETESLFSHQDEKPVTDSKDVLLSSDDHPDQSTDSTSSSFSSSSTLKNANNISTDSIYEFYMQDLLPAIQASIPLLFNRLMQDTHSKLNQLASSIWNFLLPSWWPSDKTSAFLNGTTSTSSPSPTPSSLVDILLRHFDTNNDGHISPGELLKMKEHFSLEFLQNQFNDGSNFIKGMPNPGNYFANNANSNPWYLWQASWPMLDWKIGVFLWRSCGGLLLLIVLFTIIPGRLHSISGRILRIPILCMVYVMIMAELMVYVVIRMFIKLAEAVFANSKHRRMRVQMEGAQSYEEWYETAKKLDISKKRTLWQTSIQDETSSRYNWAFIRELIHDLRAARTANDSIMALAVLQQCTRKNVGGIMSEDLFSYTNTGETKYIVQEFVEEVVTTLRYITEGAKSVGPPRRIRSMDCLKDMVSPEEVIMEEVEEMEKEEWYNENLNVRAKQEKQKLYRNITEWATLAVFQTKSGDDDDDGGVGTSGSKPPTHAIVKAGGSDKHGKTVTYLPAATPKSNNATIVPKQQLQSTKTSPPCDGMNDIPNNHHRETVKKFLKRARAAYGRTALCLSGGGMMGNYHYGSVKALIDNDCLPHIISGTSAGSIIGALVCTRNDFEIKRDLKPEILAARQQCFARSWTDRLKSIYRNGHLFDANEWYDLIKWFTCGELTFEEAYKKTGRVFCITLSATTVKAPPVLLNYISAPNVVIASAIIASAAVPGFIKPVRIKVKDAGGVVREMAEDKDQSYWDGSITRDIPTEGLAEMLNCQFFIAAQANPHIVPFVYNAKGDVGRPSRWSNGLRDDSWRGGFLLSALEMYIKSDIRSKVRFLADLEVGGFVSSMFSQKSYSGTTTIVPQVHFQDFFKIFSNPSLEDMERYFQGGSVAAYQHCAMIKLHYGIAHALDDCVLTLEEQEEDYYNAQQHGGGGRTGLQSSVLGGEKQNHQRTLDNSSSSSSCSPKQKCPEEGDNNANKKRKSDNMLSLKSSFEEPLKIPPAECNPVVDATFTSPKTKNNTRDEYEMAGFDGMGCSFSLRSSFKSKTNSSRTQTI